MADSLTPMLAQYRAIKRQHEDVILLFRLGDFYEMFGEDAKVASGVLELVLTSRELGKGRRIPMCGIPYHAADRYLARLLAAGHKAAVCEQVEDPRQAKGLVKREVVRILTPGTLVEDHLLDPKASNYLVAVAQSGNRWGLAAADGSTGEMMVTEFSADGGWEELRDEVARLQPSEVLARKGGGAEAALEQVVSSSDGVLTTWEEEVTLAHTPAELLMRHFGVASLKGFGCEEMPAAIEAAAAVITYLKKTQLSGVEQIRDLRTYSRQQFMVVDVTTRRNLELLASLRDGSRANTLMWVLDHTLTPMGGRLLCQWITAPLVDPAEIARRLDVVEALLAEGARRSRLREELRGVRDLERLLARAAAGAATGRDLAGLRDSLAALPRLAESLAQAEREVVSELVRDFDPVADLRELLEQALEESPPATLREPGIIRDGYSAELDALRRARTEGKEWIAGLQKRERQRTGIKSLKVGYNQVFGYYIEVTKPNLQLAPEDYQRRQTMANAERFVTPELKEYESRVLGAEERILALEQELFGELRGKVVAEAGRIQRAAEVVARADVLACFAEVASRNRYCRPTVTDGDEIQIRAGRHPVVELTLRDERFVPNDAALDCSENQLLIITGPNMAGKSTYLRQVALIVLMAQIGSFVPAESASIGVVDRIFTRVGASDDLATGQSTFMVEMTETANILHHATKHSLIILDEIGRGTSTFDGMSLAWAVAEHIHNSPRLGAKALFATHYHHLNELSDSLPRVKNYRIAVKEVGDQIVFLRQIVPGGTDRSYGIQVARLAGLPLEVIERAKQVLWSLEQRNHVGQPQAAAGGGATERRSPLPGQVALFGEVPDPILEELRGVNVNNLTPMQALAKLVELRERAMRKADSGDGKED